VVVSVDGNRATHDARRGAGTYDRTVGNLHGLMERKPFADISLAAVLSVGQVEGPPGESMRALARELDIRRLRFKPILPLGRAKEWEPESLPDTIWGHVDPRELVEHGFSPTSSCGIGQNLYVEPDGRSFPCYACRGSQWCLGSIVDEGLKAIIGSDRFNDLRRHTVNSNRLCRRCEMRYLCGGACRAWSRRSEVTIDDLDRSPLDCMSLHLRAMSLFRSALSFLSISEQDWKRVFDGKGFSDFWPRPE
jgi:uncharacterized protein